MKTKLSVNLKERNFIRLVADQKKLESILEDYVWMKLDYLKKFIEENYRKQDLAKIVLNIVQVDRDIFNTSNFYHNLKSGQLLDNFLYELFNPMEGFESKGRSSLIADTFIKIALNNPDVRIKVTDHFPGVSGVRNIIALIAEKLKERQFKNEDFKLTSISLTYHEKREWKMCTNDTIN